MTSVIRIGNLPEIANQNLIIEFLSKATTQLGKIEIKQNYADVEVLDEEEVDNVLMLDRQDILGYTVSVQRVVEIDESSEPEILVEESYDEVINQPKDEVINEPNVEVINETNDEIINEPIGEVVRQPLLIHSVPLVIKQENSKEKIKTPEQLKKLLQTIDLKPRKPLNENDPFAIITSYKVAIPITLFTLLSMTFSDIFG